MKKLLWVVVLIILFVLPRTASAATETHTFTGKYPITITSSSPTTANVSVLLPAMAPVLYGADICIFTQANFTCDNDYTNGNISGALFHKHVETVYKTNVTVPFALTGLDPTQKYYVAMTTILSGKSGDEYSANFQTATPDTFSYTFAVTKSGSTITAKMGNALGSKSSYQLIAQTSPFPAGQTAPTVGVHPLPGDSTVQQADAQGNVTWSIKEYPSTTYYIRVLEIPITTVKKPSYVTASQTITTDAEVPVFQHLTTITNTSSTFVQGSIDPVKTPDYTDWKVYLSYSKTATATGLTNPIDINEQSHSETGPNSPKGISTGTLRYPQGNYYWTLEGLTPGATYYMQQTFILGDNTSIPDRIETLTAGSGTLTPFTPTTGPTGTSADLNPDSYTLISKGFPGLTVLPDPILCAQERAAGKTPQFCDINDVLNYFMKLMIGLCGVVLVIRLMVEGYNIMVSDIPRVKVAAKTSFFTMLGGLVLALSSYIILNTINPKLVNGTVGLSQLSIGVDGDTNAPITLVPNAQMPGSTYCPGSGKSAAISKIAQSFIGKVSYSFGGKSAAAQSNGIALLDCSGWANTVIACAGYKSPPDYINSGSADIFSKAEQVKMSTGFVINGNNVSINGKVLNPGDLVGWPTIGSSIGHVILYIGNATFMDSHSSKVPGGAIGTYTAAKLQSAYGGSNPTKTITGVKRIPL